MGNFSPLSAGFLVGARQARNDLPEPMDPRLVHAIPGIVKVRAPPLVEHRTVTLASAPAGRWRELLDAADVVSEGGTRPEGDRLVYYGSTSVLLLRRSAGGALPDAEVGAFCSLIRADPHVRLRVLRIAWREASARAPRPLGTLRAEIDVAPSARGVSLLVEVMARLSRGHARASLDGG